MEAVALISKTDPVQQRLTALRDVLLKLHKTLLDSEREFYELEVGKIESPGQMLNLVLNDPWFGWLRDLSQLVVTIDETQESKDNPPTEAVAERLIGEAKRMLTPDQHGFGFAKSYDAATQRDPDVFIAHVRTIRTIAKL